MRSISGQNPSIISQMYVQLQHSQVWITEFIVSERMERMIDQAKFGTRRVSSSNRSVSQTWSWVVTGREGESLSDNSDIHNCHLPSILSCHTIWSCHLSLYSLLYTVSRHILYCAYMLLKTWETLSHETFAKAELRTRQVWHCLLSHCRIVANHNKYIYTKYTILLLYTVLCTVCIVYIYILSVCRISVIIWCCWLLLYHHYN